MAIQFVFPFVIFLIGLQIQCRCVNVRSHEICSREKQHCSVCEIFQSGLYSRSGRVVCIDVVGVTYCGARASERAKGSKMHYLINGNNK